MTRSTDLIQSNSQIFRVYTRRLSNPADADIFITSAGKLATFLSNARAYYAQAQLPIIEILEVSLNALKNVAPSVFDKPDSLNKSAIPVDKVPLFDAFDKLANTVTPYLSHFTDESLRSRLLSFLSSVGVSLPPETTSMTSAAPPIQASADPPTGHQADPPAPRTQLPSPIGTASPDPMVMTSGLLPTVKGTAGGQPVTAMPTSAPVQVQPPAPVEVKGSDDGVVASSAPSQQIVQSPTSMSPGRPLSPEAPVPRDVTIPVATEPNQTSHLPTSSLPRSSGTPSLHAQPSSPVSAPRIASPSTQKIPTTPSVTLPSALPHITPQSQDTRSIPPSLISTGQVGVVQVSQSGPLSQVEPPTLIPTPLAPPVSSSPGRKKPKPPPRRQSSGLDFLQLDLQVAREKKQRAAADAQKSGSATQVSPPPVPPISTEITATTSPSSASTAGMPGTPAVLPSSSTAPTAVQVAPAPTHLPTGTAPVHTTATTFGGSSTTLQSQQSQTPSPSLVHRDLRQGSRNGASGANPRKLRITDRAPPPPPEPGSEVAPIVIEDEEPRTMPTSEPIYVDSPIEALPIVTALDPAGSNRDMRDDGKPQPGPEGKATSEQVPQQNTSVSASVCEKPSGASGIQPQQGSLGENEKQTGEDSLESPGPLIIGEVAGATTESPLGKTGVMPPAPATTAPTAVVPESPSATVTSPDANEPGPQPHPAKLNRIGGHTAASFLPEASVDTGKRQRSPTRTNDDTRRVSPRKTSIAERKQDTPTVSLQSGVAGSTLPATVNVNTRGRRKEGEAEITDDHSFPPRQALSQIQPTSSSGASVSILPAPRAGLHPTTELLSNAAVSRSSTIAPPIVVLGTRSGRSSASNPSSDSRSVSPASGNRLLDAGTGLVKAEELEDEMIDELAPLFGKEMRVICMDMAYDIPGEFTWEFNLPPMDWDRVSRWAKAPENLDSDISHVRCVTLACYAMQDLEPYANQDGMACEKWFENVRPIPWAKLPRYLWALVNDKFTEVFPPYLSPDDLFDISPLLQLGPNKITFTQIDGMAEYVFVLHGHYPTRGQLVPLRARWDQERRFMEQLEWFARPFTIEEW